MFIVRGTWKREALLLGVPCAGSSRICRSYAAKNLWVLNAINMSLLLRNSITLSILFASAEPPDSSLDAERPLNLDRRFNAGFKAANRIRRLATIEFRRSYATQTLRGHQSRL